MEIRLTLNSAFESVYLVNGKLVEGGEILYGDSEVVYITVLPLDATLLPYTVKLVGAALKCNAALCKCYNLGSNKFHLKLLPRHNFVYGVSRPDAAPDGGLPEKFFSVLKAGKVNVAREYLTADLSDSIDDASLQAFFEGFVDILPADKQSGLYFLARENGAASMYRFILRGTLIENIAEADTAD